jgi:Flp pilus assembly protein TadG
MRSSSASSERGQIIVIFALSLVAITAMVGLVLDGGGAFAQRRAEQNASDIAALAAANELIVNLGSSDWHTTALNASAQNGYTHGVGGVNVEATCINCPGQVLNPAVDGVQVTVNVTAPHRNNFAAIVGMSTWQVATTATSKTGFNNTAQGPGPFIVSINSFDPDSGLPIACTSPADPCTLEHPVGDFPLTESEFTWTDFGYDHPFATEDPTDCEVLDNVNDNDLQDYMDNQADFSVTLTFGCYIGQHNDGVMNNVVARLELLAPITFPVPIVDTEGKYVGWASFVVMQSDPGGRNGFLTGYYETGAQNEQLDVSGAGFGNSIYGGTWDLELVN